jgi:hypothetical protein
MFYTVVFANRSISSTVPEAEHQQYASPPQQPRQPRRRKHHHSASFDWIDELVRQARPRIHKPNTQRKPSETLASGPQNADDKEPGQPEQSTTQRTLTTIEDSPESGKKRSLARQAKGVANKPSDNTDAPQKPSNPGISKASPNMNTKRSKNRTGTSPRADPQQIQSHHPEDREEFHDTHLVPQMQRVRDLSTHMHGIVHGVDNLR